MKNKEQNTNKSQLDKANAALKELAVNVTSEDRKESPYSEPTLVKYLKGNGKDLGTAIKLLEFLRKRIAEREKVLAA